jgi:hypothetical protein
MKDIRKILEVLAIFAIILVQVFSVSATINKSNVRNMSRDKNLILNKKVIFRGFFFIFALITDFTYWPGSYHSPPHYTIEMKRAIVYGVGFKIFDIDGEIIPIPYPVCRLILKDSTVEGSFIIGPGIIEFMTPSIIQSNIDFLFVFTVSGCVIYVSNLSISKVDNKNREMNNV